jgi:hypothetical protein
MRVSRFLVLVAVLSLAAFVPARALATDDNDESQTYLLEMEAPNSAMSADGDLATLTGMAMFSVHPKSFTGSGTFTLTNDGTTVSGTWTGLELLAFQPYGCGVVAGTPLPPFACGGMVQARILLTPTGGGETMTAILRVVCIIGDVPGQYFVSKNATEGITLDVPGVENYNHQAGGMNVYIFTGGEPG